MFLQVATLVLVAVAGGAALKLPDYITPCHRSSAEFQQCALASARKALPHIIEGDRKFRIPPLDPVSITSLVIETPGSVQLKMTLTDVKIAGHRALELRNISIDLAARTLNYAAWMPRWELTGQYDVSGQVVLLPVTGQGNCNFTLENVEWTAAMKFETETKANGKKYMRVTGFDLESSTTRAHSLLENLFGGNKILGDQLNGFINDNWQEMMAVVKPFFVEALKTVYLQAFEGLLDKVTYDDIFPE